MTTEGAEDMKWDQVVTRSSSANLVAFIDNERGLYCFKLKKSERVVGMFNTPDEANAFLDGWFAGKDFA